MVPFTPVSTNDKSINSLRLTVRARSCNCLAFDLTDADARLCAVQWYANYRPPVASQPNLITKWQISLLVLRN